MKDQHVQFYELPRKKLKNIRIKNKNDFTKISHSQPIQINAVRIAETCKKVFDPKNVAKRNAKIAKANNIEDPVKKANALQKAFDYAKPKFKRKADCNDSLFYPHYFKIRKSKEGKYISFTQWNYIWFAPSNTYRELYF